MDFVKKGRSMTKRLWRLWGAEHLSDCWNLTRISWKGRENAVTDLLRYWPGALEGLDIVPEKLSYEGPFGVGYGVCSFCGRAKDPYVALARKSLETYIRTGEAMEVPEGLPEEMLKNRPEPSFP